MKRAALVFLSSWVLLLPLVVQAYTVDLRYGWDAGDIEVKQIGEYDYVGVEGSVYSSGTTGTIYEMRGLPVGHKVESYRVVREEWAEVGAGYRLGVGVGEEMAALEGDQPGGLEHVASGDLVGWPVMVTAVKPFRVVGGVVSVLKSLEVEVEYGVGGGDLRVERRSRMVNQHLSDVMGKICDVTGPGDWEVEGYKDWISEGPSVEGGAVDCVILTNEEMTSEFERLAEWHDRLGFRTAVRTMSWVEDRYRGADSAERVRAFLRDAYQKWGTVYVLIGGDPSVVPIRYAWTEHYGGAFIPTDLYYSNLEGSWNADGDHIYGEWGAGSEADPGDQVTFYPQLMLGRAPVRDSAEAYVFVDKSLSYALTPEPGFPATAALYGEVIFPQDWLPGQPITLDGGAICDTAARYFPASFDTALLYQRSGTMTRTTCLDAFTHGYNFNIIAGHGDAFRTSAAEGDPPYLFTTDFDTLSNQDRYGFTYALNCNNAAIDVDCIFRHLMTCPTGGNFAVYATTRYDFPNVGQYFLNEFLDFVFWRGVTRLGDACALHCSTFIPSALDHDGSVRWTMLTYIVLGDPVLWLWDEEPAALEVLEPGQMGLGDSLYTVQVKKGGVAMGGAVVTLVGDRGEYGLGVSESDGYVTLAYRPRGLGWVDLTVSGHGALVYSDSVQVVGATGRLYVSGTDVDDGTVGGIGNNDGVAGWGELVGLGVGVRNGGAGVLPGVVGDLRVVAGCSLWVDVEIDGLRDAGLMHIGMEGGGPESGSVPFGLGISEDVFGRCTWQYAESLACCVWLDGMGWHVRMEGDGGTHTYRCELSVFGELLGVTGSGLEAGDSVAVGGSVVFGGTLGAVDYEDGIDLVVGDSLSVLVVAPSQSYGSVGASEVMEYYDTWFLSTGVGDGAGIWFEMEITSEGTSWFDWFRVEVFDGDLILERLATADLGEGIKSVDCGVRNLGGGSLMGVNGTLRGLSGVQITDSVNAYGDIPSGGYSVGDGFRASELGGPVRYQLKLRDAHGRVWRDTIDVRVVDAVSGLAGEVGADHIELWWPQSADSELAAYDVYRAGQKAGPYQLVGDVDGYARYVDDGLESESDYYYYIRTRDATGNLSAASETLEIWTGAPYLPGWPVGTGNVIASSVAAADVDRNGDVEVVVGSKDESIYMWHHDGTLMSGWPRRTQDIVVASPAIANIDGDSQLEILIGSRDGYLYAYNYDGTGVLNSNGRFKQTSGAAATPVVDDLDGDRDFEVIVANDYGQVYIWHHNGVGWSNSNGLFRRSGYAVYAAPTVADIDGDHQSEIIIGTTGSGIYAWNLDGTGVIDTSGKFANVNTYGSVVVGDVDYNGDMELVAGTVYGTNLCVLAHNGSFHPGWPRPVDNYIYAAATLACLDNDNRLDIIVGTVRKTGVDTASVYVFSHTGATRTGWPKRAKGDFYGSAVVGDIDGDLQPDIVIGCTDGRIYAWHKDGTPVKGWPRNAIYEFQATPMICDLDKDGKVDLLMSGSDALVHAFDISATYNKGTMEWPKSNHDLVNSNLYGGPSRSDVPPVGPGEVPGALTAVCYPSPAFSSVSVRLGVPSAAAAEKIVVDVYDVRGRLVRRVMDQAAEPGFLDVQWNGTDGGNRRVSSGIYFIKVSSRGESLDRKVVLVR